jgi:hypothetical protein
MKNRKSVLALVVETAEGTPKAPAANTDYTALQEGFDFNPQFSELTSAELQDSIGQSKTILGTESPTMSFSHYLKHSGVEGQAPDYGIVLHSLLGLKTAAGAERVTAAASTTTIVKVPGGIGVNFRKGQALLVKDPVNGYSIRNILSIAGDNLTLGHALALAPGAGVALGRAVHYEAASEGHPSLSVWGYRANGGAVELIAGGKVTDMSIDIAAGELINANFTLAGTGYYFNPIEIDAAHKYIDFNEGGASLAATVNLGFYKDPHELADSIAQAMNAVAAANITCVYNDATGKYTITSDGATFEIEWNTGANVANTIAPKIGYLTAADDSGGLIYTSDNAISLAAPHTPAYDQTSPVVAKANEILLGLQGQIACFGARAVSIKVGNQQERQPDLCSDSGFRGTENTSRTVEFTIKATLAQYESQKYSQFRKGDTIAFAYNLGEKVGGNWVAGKCVNMYAPFATISSFKLTDENGVVGLEMGVKAYVNSGDPEFHVNYL